MIRWLILLAGLLAFISYDFYVESRLAARDAAREAQFKAALGAIEAQRQTEEKVRVQLDRERTALKTEIDRQKAALTALAGRSRGAGEATARDQERAKALEAAPTWEALKSSAGRLGVAVKPVVR